MKRILIADDHVILRQGLKQILSQGLRDVIFGEAGDAVETLAVLGRQEWDVLLLDVNMPGRSGFDVLADAVRDFPHLQVLILSSIPEEIVGLRAIKGGAAGYLNKHTSAERLIEAVETVLGGGRFISPLLANMLAAEFQQTGGRPRHELLSERELQVLHLITAGKAVKEIAAELSLSSKTISTFRSRIFDKLGLRNDVELVRYAQQHGLTPNG